MSEKAIEALIASNEKLFRDLNAKLDAIIKLLVLVGAADKNLSEQIWILSAAGLQPKEIAHTLGTTPNAVRVMLSSMRKSRRK